MEYEELYRLIRILEALAKAKMEEVLPSGVSIEDFQGGVDFWEAENTIVRKLEKETGKEGLFKHGRGWFIDTSSLPNARQDLQIIFLWKDLPIEGNFSDLDFEMMPDLKDLLDADPDASIFRDIEVRIVDNATANIYLSTGTGPNTYSGLLRDSKEPLFDLKVGDMSELQESKIFGSGSTIGEQIEKVLPMDYEPGKTTLNIDAKVGSVSSAFTGDTPFVTQDVLDNMVDFDKLIEFSGKPNTSTVDDLKLFKMIRDREVEGIEGLEEIAGIHTETEIAEEVAGVDIPDTPEGAAKDVVPDDISGLEADYQDTGLGGRPFEIEDGVPVDKDGNPIKSIGNADETITIYRVVPEGVNSVNANDWVFIDKRQAEEALKNANANTGDNFHLIEMEVSQGDVYSSKRGNLEMGYYPKDTPPGLSQGPGTAHIDDIAFQNTQLIDNLPIEQVVKDRWKNMVAKRYRNLVTPGGVLDAVDVWEFGVMGLMMLAIAYKEYDEIPKIFSRTATNMFNSMTAAYNIPPVPLEQYDLDYEFMNKVLETGEKVMPTDILWNKVKEVVKGVGETGTVTGFGYVPTTSEKTDTIDKKPAVEFGVQEEKMFEKEKPRTGKGGSGGEKIYF